MQKIFSCLLLTVIVIALCSGTIQAETSNQLQLSAVLPNPAGADSQFEWLELYNASSLAVDLNQYSLRVGSSRHTVSASAKSLAPGQVIYLAANPTSFLDKYPGLEVLGLPFTLPNSSLTITLLKGDVELATSTYDQSSEDLVTFWQHCQGSTTMTALIGEVTLGEPAIERFCSSATPEPSPTPTATGLPAVTATPLAITAPTSTLNSYRRLNESLTHTYVAAAPLKTDYELLPLSTPTLEPRELNPRLLVWASSIGIVLTFALARFIQVARPLLLQCLRLAPKRMKQWKYGASW